MSLDACDYDGRTALHVAASEGQIATIDFLMQHVKNRAPRDRCAFPTQCTRIEQALSVGDTHPSTTLSTSAIQSAVALSRNTHKSTEALTGDKFYSVKL